MRKLRGFTLIEILLLIVICFFLVSCAGVQEKWNQMTPQDQAKIIAEGFQDQIDSMLNEGIAYVKANPQYTAKWGKEILPAIKIANETMGEVIVTAKAGGLVPGDVYAKTVPLINKIVTYLNSIGLIKFKKVEAPPASQNAAIDIALLMMAINSLLGLAYNLWDKASKISKGTIPTWEEISSKNAITALKIEDEEKRVAAALLEETGKEESTG